MLNILKKKQSINDNNINDIVKYTDSLNNNLTRNDNVFPNKGWSDNVYSYNYQYNKLLAHKNKITNYLFDTYLNIYFLDSKLKNIFKSKRIKNNNRSAKRIFLSKPNIKHTNTKIIFTLYLYNKKQKFLVFKIKKFLKSFRLYLKKNVLPIHYKKKLKYNVKLKISYLKTYLLKLKRLYVLYNYIKGFKNLNNIINLKVKLLNDIKYLKIKQHKYKALKNKLFKHKFLSEQHKNKRLSTLKLLWKKKKTYKLLLKIIYLYKLYNYLNCLYNINNKNLKNKERMPYTAFLFNIFLKNTLIFKYITYIMYYNQLWLMETIKYKTILLNFKGLGIIGLIKKIYEKELIIDIINHKYVHLNSDILSNSVQFKLRNRKVKILRILNKVFRKIKTPSNNEFLTENKIESVKKDVIKNLKNRGVSGIKLQGSGRLTKRLTAMRSIYKIRYKGTLKDINSSIKGYYSPVVIGHLKYNLQYSKIDGKTRNGSFGLKCWISSF